MDMKTYILIIQAILVFGDQYWKDVSGTVDFSHLTLWGDISVRSRVECLLYCYMAYCSGCGYKEGGGRCHLYLDWGETVNSGNQDIGVDYYVPISGSIFKNGWIDLRRHGVNSAVLPDTANVTQPEAVDVCASLGSTLYEMPTESKRLVLELEFCVNPPIFWVGLMKGNGPVTKSPSWRWLSGESAVLTSLWASGEPMSEVCAVAHGLAEYRLHNLRCSDEIQALCELTI